LTNFYLGLARGPIDHQSSSVINSIADGPIEMGSAVILAAPSTSELLARVTESTALDDVAYGIAVGGDTDGIYGDGSAATDDSTRATAGAGQGVVVVTQGRCLARVRTANQAGTGVEINIGDKLVAGVDGGGGLAGQLIPATNANETIIATALQEVLTTDTDDIIAVDVQREGLFT
jgi:hypothetical protein